jgi:lactate permease
MPVALLAAAAFVPIAVVLILMVVLRWPAGRAMPLAWLSSAVIGIMPWRTWATSTTLSVENLFGYEHVDWSFQPFYVPGLIPFVLVAVLTVFIHRMKARKVKAAWKDAVSRIRRPAVALLFAVATVEILQQSAFNPRGLDAMPLSMAAAAAQTAGWLWPLWAPFVGALGSFITGSNAVANLLFAEFQCGMAAVKGAPHQIIIALQAVGGAMVNMISLHNVVAASATVGLVGVEGIIIRRNLFPMLLYGIIIGTAGLVFSYILFPHVF